MTVPQAYVPCSFLLLDQPSVSSLFLQLEKGDQQSDKSNVIVKSDEITDPTLYIDPHDEKKLLRRIDGYVISLLGVSLT